MIAPLRQWHRRTTAVMVVAVPALFGATIATRPDAPFNSTLPTHSVPTVAIGSQPLAWTCSDIAAELVHTADGATEVALDARTVAVDPDVLVYWLESSDSAEPPEAGRLLGAAQGGVIRRITLPIGAEARGGRLVLYSLAHDEVIASTTIDASGGQ